MFCQICGTENPDGSAFCKGCGSVLKAAPAPAAEPIAATPVEETPVDTQTDYTPVPTKNPGKGLGIAAMVLGIVSLVVTCCCCVCMSYFSPFAAIPFAIVGLILGIIGNKKSKSVGLKNTMATVGIILSIVSLVIGVIVGVLFILYLLVGVGASIFGASQSSPSYGYNDYYYYY